MNTRLIVALALSALVACSDEEPLQTTPWGVEYSDVNAIGTTAGIIDQQNAGPRVSFPVDEGYLKPLTEKEFTLMYKFATGDALQLVITKRTADYNFHFPGDANVNQLHHVIFNGDTLSLEASTVAVQPRTGENKLTTVVKLHSLEAGDFNGTVSSIPLLRE